MEIVEINNLYELLTFVNQQSNYVFGFTLLFIPFLLMLFFSMRKFDFYSSLFLSSFFSLILGIFLAFYNLVPAILVYIFGILSGLSLMLVYLFKRY
ncbi:MAG: hypothetical protein QXI77_02110 [Nanopusillaceae archaeon]